MRSAAHLELVRESVTTAATLAHQRTLPVVADLAAVVPTAGLQRGSTLAVHGVGATSFALALAGQAIREGSFMAVIAPSSFGLAACLDFDIPLRRVVQFVLPTEAQNWAQAVAAIIEGFDVVVLADQRRVGSSQARQLVARNRERGSVLIRVGGPGWSDAADLRFDISSPEWSGLSRGYGYLHARKVGVRVAGRRYHGHNRAHQVMLPARHGGVALAPDLSDLATPDLSGQSPATATVSAAQGRFAGSDIDAMLDVVDQDPDASGGDAGYDAIA